MRARQLPAWRSLLFCPANGQRFIDKAHTRGADAIILDLEDSVAPRDKPAARAMLGNAVTTVGQGGADVLVRINRELDLAVEDIQAAVAPGVKGLVVPKVMGPEHLQLLSELIDAREQALGMPSGQTGILALVESAAALEKLPDIARAHARMVGLAVGGEDLATDLHAEPTADALYVAKMMGVHAARAAGILPVGTLAGVSALADNDGYRAMLKRSRGLGFACATCVHPAQVPLLNEAFGPSRADIERARAMLAVYEEGLSRGVGAVKFEDLMVDKPVADRAYQILERAKGSA